MPACATGSRARGPRAYLERWTESAVIPRYLEIVRRAAERKGRRDVVERLTAHDPAAAGAAPA